jgi:hypothetical protein
VNLQLLLQRRLVVAGVTLLAGAVAFTVGLVLFGSRDQAGPLFSSPPHARRDLSVAWHVGPSLRELQANFAVLRRPATAKEHALLTTFTAATNDQPDVPEYVRQAGIADGSHVYFIVYPVFRHGASGPVVAYEMAVSADDAGMSYVPGSYLIFPNVIGGFGEPRAYVSVVPDGVRKVRWHFTCRPYPASSACQLPAENVVSVPVRDNLAVLPITTGGDGTADPNVDRVTWYRSDGSHTVFTNQNKAVPFPGAPERQMG